jgi:hypothetical protein
VKEETRAIGDKWRLAGAIRLARSAMIEAFQTLLYLLFYPIAKFHKPPTSVYFLHSIPSKITNFKIMNIIVRESFLFESYGESFKQSQKSNLP